MKPELTLEAENATQKAPGLLKTSSRRFFTASEVAPLEKALQESEERYQLLVANMFEGVVLHQMIPDSNGRFVDYRVLEVSGQFEKVLGLRRDDVVGKLSREAYGSETIPFLEEYSQAVLGKKACRFDAYFAPLDRHFSISVAPWGDHGFATIFTDITEQKRAEEQLKNLNAHLEDLVSRETTRRVMQERVLARQARHAAMGEMVGAIAHQWRQPLSTVSVIVQNMAAAWKFDRLSREYVDQALEVAQQQVAYMTSTIEEFLAFFRPDKQKEVFCINDKVLESLSFVEGQLQAQGIVVTAGEGFSEDHYATGYQNEFRQVILNLLVNGRDAIRERLTQEKSTNTGAGTILLDISSSPSGVAVEVTDNGSGIAPDIGDRVFEPYFTTREKSGGTGIGLYMSRLIVEEGMGGELSYLSEPGRTVFKIILPAAERE